MEPTIAESLIDDSQLISNDNDVLEKSLFDNKENDEAENVNEDPSVLLEGNISNLIKYTF